MALGKRRESRQQELWIAADRVARTPRHEFYDKLNKLLAKAEFDPWIERLCRPHYAEVGRDSIPPGVYFRMLLVGYFEGIDGQRGIAWRCADSLSLASSWATVRRSRRPTIRRSPRSASGCRPKCTTRSSSSC